LHVESGSGQRRELRKKCRESYMSDDKSEGERRVSND